MKRIALLLISLILLFSCSPDSFDKDYQDGSWSSAFSLFWSGMNENYVFWDIDSPGTEWDDVYDEYLPRFDSLGNIGSENDDEGFALLYEIVSRLSDGHFMLKVYGSSDYCYYSFYDKLLHEAGFSDEEILQHSEMQDGVFYPEIESVTEVQQHEALSENTKTILENDFGISEDGFYTEPGTGNYSDDFELFMANAEKSDVMILGRTYDGIVYFSISEFFFYRYLHSSNPMRAMLDEFNSLIVSPQTKGIIIDLRGNVGGYNTDIPLLWSRFVTERTPYMIERTKMGRNRLDYTPWAEIVMEPESSGYSVGEDIPVAVIINSGSFSNAEISALFFKALKDEGREIVFIGSRTFGAFGSALGNEAYNAGSFSTQNMSIQTQSVEHRYIDGTNYEGIGFPADIEILFNYDDFVSGKDNRLETALDWIREKH